MDAPRFGAIPITLGLVESIESLIGGSDTITTLDGDDIVIGGIDADTILGRRRRQPRLRRQRPDRLDRPRARRRRSRATTSTRPTSTGSGRSTPITVAATSSRTGDGDDIVIGGEDGEIVTDAIIATHTAVERTVAPDSLRGDGDTIFAGHGRNLVFGDNGRISAAGMDVAAFGGHNLTLGLVTSIESLIGGSDDDHGARRRRHRDRRHRRRHDHRRRGRQPDRRRQRADRLDRPSSTAARWRATTSTRPTSTGSGRSTPITAAATYHDRRRRRHRHRRRGRRDRRPTSIDRRPYRVTAPWRPTRARRRRRRSSPAMAATWSSVTTGRSARPGWTRRVRRDPDHARPGGVDRVADRRLGHDHGARRRRHRDRRHRRRHDHRGPGRQPGRRRQRADRLDRSSSTAARWPGDDFNAFDIDRFWSIDPDHGGSDVIRLGDGDDIVIGGRGRRDRHRRDHREHTAVDRTVAPDACAVTATSIFAGHGRNLVFGDNGQISAAGMDAPRFGGHTITLGLVESIESLIGGSDAITVARRRRHRDRRHRRRHDPRPARATT